MNDFFTANSNRPMDGLKLVSRCPVCQTEHNPMETSILNELEGSHLLYIKCRKCGSGVVASVTPNALGMASLGVVTDLTAAEIKEAANWGQVNEDDVLSAISYLKAGF